MSPRPKKSTEVEVAIPVTEGEDATPEQIEEAEEFLSEPVNQEEFNKFIEHLAQNAAERVIAGLDARVRDLEGLVQVLIGKTGAVNHDPSAGPGPEYFTPVEVDDYTPDLGDDVPEYKPAHQDDDGIPWYRG